MSPQNITSSAFLLAQGNHGTIVGLSAITKSLININVYQQEDHIMYYAIFIGYKTTERSTK